MPTDEHGNVLDQGTTTQGQPGTELEGGQPPEGTTGTEGQPGAGEGTPGGETLPEGYVREDEYKELQRKFSSTSDAKAGYEKDLEQYGGIDQVKEWLGYLSGNENFAKWIQTERQSELTGTPAEEMDDETKQALEMVQKISRDTVEKAIQEQVEPIAASLKNKLMEENMGEMDKKYGEDWREMASTMTDLSKTLSDSVQDKPNFKDFEGLYMRSLIETGQFDKYAANIYQRKLEASKSKSTTPPAGTQPTKPTKSTSIAESLRRAEEKLGQKLF